MNKIGRNEPCPCGSGKKYKNCCSRSMTSAQLNKIVLAGHHQEHLAKFSFDHYSEEIGKRTREYIEQYSIDHKFEQTYANLIVCWEMFHSIVKDGKSPIDLYLEEVTGKEKPEMMELLGRWKQSNPSLYRVSEKLNRNTFTVNDLFTEKEYSVEFNTEMLPQDETALAGTLLFTGVNYEFYIDYAQVPLSSLSSKLEQLRSASENKGIENMMISDFPEALSIILSETESKAEHDPETKLDGVLAVLQQNADEATYNEAQPVWEKYRNMKKPVIRKEGPYAAALHYYVSKDILQKNMTQSETARRYDISASSLSAKYRQLKSIMA